MSLKYAPPPTYGQRRVYDVFMRGVVLFATLLAVVPLILIIGYVLFVGGRALNADFFTQTYRPPLSIAEGSGGNVTNPDDSVLLPDPATGIEIPPEYGTEAFTAATGLEEVVPEETTEGSSTGGTSEAGVEASATVDPFANLDIGGLAGAGGDPTASADGTTGQTTMMAGTSSRGGVLHGIVGTLLVTLAGLLMALPIGLLAGIFLAEFGKNRLAVFIRFCCDVLSGAPSIVAGVVAYTLIVNNPNIKSFSGLAGSAAIALLMVPTITRTTEEILRLVPNSTREAARAMGAPTWYSTFTVVIPTALTGIVTGVLLAFARGAGETAPLLLTIQGNTTLVTNLLRPMAALPLLTYQYTESPFPAENTLAWGTAFVLMMLVLLVNILVRLATRSRMLGR